MIQCFLSALCFSNIEGSVCPKLRLMQLLPLTLTSNDIPEGCTYTKWLDYIWVIWVHLSCCFPVWVHSKMRVITISTFGFSSLQHICGLQQAPPLHQVLRGMERKIFIGGTENSKTSLCTSDGFISSSKCGRWRTKLMFVSADPYFWANVSFLLMP